MKKNKMMRLASGLLVAVLLTTSMISGTFAKYVTEGSGSDNARVAKWGVTITANGETFANTYAKDDDSFDLAANTVVSTEDVVAPGTTGDMVSMKLSGTPEVAVRIEYKGTFDISNWVVDAEFYCPLIINVEGTPINGADYTDETAFEKAVNDAIANCSKDYPAGTDLSTAGVNVVNVTWEWPFSTSAENDVKDTKLGNVAVTGDAATVKLAVTTTATQID